jgi:hypothetical protein
VQDWRAMAEITSGSGVWIDHDQLRSLYGFWRQARDRRAFPAWSRFFAEDFKPWMGHIMLIEPQDTPLRFRVRLHGTKLGEYDGKDLTGWVLDDAVPERGHPDVIGPYVKAVVSGEPQYDITTSPFHEGTVRRLCRLVLPCSEDGGQVDRLIVGLYLDLAEQATASRKLCR